MQLPQISEGLQADTSDRDAPSSVRSLCLEAQRMAQDLNNTTDALDRTSVASSASGAGVEPTNSRRSVLHGIDHTRVSVSVDDEGSRSSSYYRKSVRHSLRRTPSRYGDFMVSEAMHGLTATQQLMKRVGSTLSTISIASPHQASAYTRRRMSQHGPVSRVASVLEMLAGQDVPLSKLGHKTRDAGAVKELPDEEMGSTRMRDQSGQLPALPQLQTDSAAVLTEDMILVKHRLERLAAGSKFLNKEQFSQIFIIQDQSMLERAWYSFNPDEKGLVSIAAVAVRLGSLVGEGSDRAKFEFLCNLFDTDNDGQVSQDEFLQVLLRASDQSDLNFNHAHLEQAVELLFASATPKSEQAASGSPEMQLTYSQLYELLEREGALGEFIQPSMLRVGSSRYLRGISDGEASWKSVREEKSQLKSGSSRSPAGGQRRFSVAIFFVLLQSRGRAMLWLHVLVPPGPAHYEPLLLERLRDDVHIQVWHLLQWG